MRLVGTHLFLAAPYSQWIDPLTELVHDHHRNRLDRVRRAFMDAGASVFNAHHNEQWGAGWLPALECTAADFRAMQLADAVCAFVGTPPSGGVAVELGWASALGKPILLVQDRYTKSSPLINGLASITRADYLEEPEEWDDNWLRTLVNGVCEILNARPVSVPAIKGSTGFVNSRDAS